MPASLTDLEGLTVHNSGNQSDATTSIPAPLDNVIAPASSTVPTFETMDDMPALLTEEVAAPSEVSANHSTRRLSEMLSRYQGQVLFMSDKGT